MKKSSLLLLIFLIVSAHTLYSTHSAIKQLTVSTFSQTKTGIWLVQFYAPWCGHCKNLAPQYEKAAKALKGIANIAAVNGDQERIPGVSIQGFPTIKLYVDGKESDYSGDRTAQGIVNFIINKYRNIANERLGGGSSGNSHSHQSHQSSGGSDEKDVIVLTDRIFEQNVYGDESAWFVEFYAPWCGHCKTLAPEWAELATNLKGEVKVAKVDATENKESAGKFGVSGYPTIKFFPGGKKDDSSAVDYSGPRTASAMAEWARQQTKELKHFEHVQLTSQKQYDQYCGGRGLCVITFLPNILDSSQTERENYLEQIKQVGLKFRGKPFKFLWAQGGDHFDFQQKVGAVGVGYPVVTVIYQTKSLFGKLRKAFNVENLDGYLSDILNNKVRMNKLPPLEPLKTVKVEEVSQGQEYGEEGHCDQTKCTAPTNEENDL